MSTISIDGPASTTCCWCGRALRAITPRIAAVTADDAEAAWDVALAQLDVDQALPLVAATAHDVRFEGDLFSAGRCRPRTAPAIPCPTCGGPTVPCAGGVRCPACRIAREPDGEWLPWFGD